MKKRLKKLVCLSMAVGCILATNINVFAAGKPINFTVKKNEGTKQTAAAAKNDNERNSYITITNMMYSTKAPCVVGLRVRRTNGDAVTAYKTYRGSVKSKVPHLSTSTAKQGTLCVLRGQVDSSSAAISITVYGQWLP